VGPRPSRARGYEITIDGVNGTHVLSVALAALLLVDDGNGGWHIV
jgi:hypothetical protein